MSKSLKMAKGCLGKKVKVVVDRPMGSKHPKGGFVYGANYGYVPDTRAPDGEELDAYFLGVDGPIGEGEGVCIAVIHREDDDDDKLVVVPEGVELADEEIMEAVEFQERYFDSGVARGN
jgi:inorganic pyrophosphatase